MERYLLDVTLTAPLADMGYPRFVGPFPSRRLAERWGNGYLPEENWNVVPIADPDTLAWAFMRPAGEATA